MFSGRHRYQFPKIGALMTTKTENINKHGHINWSTTIAMVVFHTATIAALFTIKWQWYFVLVNLVLWWVSGSLGIGIGFHRLLTHRGFKTPKPLEYFLTLCGLLALEGGAINWVVTHRIHHSKTDVPGDPHTPRDGKWWAHMGWILRGTGQQHDLQTMQRYAPDLMKDPVHLFLNRSSDHLWSYLVCNRRNSSGVGMRVPAGHNWIACDVVRQLCDSHVG
jgi:fatty-acid desaturase